MNSKLIVLLSVSLALGGCVTNLSGRVNDETQAAKLRVDNQAVAILHTSLHDVGCRGIEARLAQPDASGRYVWGQLITLRGAFDLDNVPSQVVLPAGEYGIVMIQCIQPHRKSRYFARVAQRGSIIDGSGTIFERPIATFKLGPGEVVDIGSVRLPSRATRPPSLLGGPTGEFAAVITPIPEPWLRALAASKPNLFNARIVRPMIVPPPFKPQAQS